MGGEGAGAKDGGWHLHRVPYARDAVSQVL